MAYIHHPAANVSSISKLVKSNAGDPAQVLREVVSNASDAEARNITFVPLPYPIAHAGFIAIDDGTGMSRPVEGRKDPKGRAGDSNVSRNIYCTKYMLLLMLTAFAGPVPWTSCLPRHRQ